MLVSPVVWPVPWNPWTSTHVRTLGSSAADVLLPPSRWIKIGDVAPVPVCTAVALSCVNPPPPVRAACSVNAPLPPTLPDVSPPPVTASYAAFPLPETPT